mgnify:FL=1
MNVNTRAFIENSSNGHYIAAWRDIAESTGTHPSTYDAAYGAFFMHVTTSPTAGKDAFHILPNLSTS